ncbi:MAG: M14 family metallopeptidase [Bryobacteraceae bacterium]|nr:M14 family metallopeptidase [Bryobacteraceae bacterium]
MFRFAALAVVSVPLHAQIPPMPPVSLAETPAMRAAASIASSTAAAAEDWRTHAERTDWRETGSYREAVEFHQRLARASRFAQLESIGITSEGRPLYVLIASKDRAFTPAAARRTGKPVLLIQNGIHPGENGGKDAAMMLLRDLLVTRRMAALLDRVIVLSIPVLNADGHENVSPYHRLHENGPAAMGFRASALNLNLNRDYVKADSPEIRAFLRVFAAWNPDFLLDNHVTNGGDAEYDVTIATHTEQDIDEEVGAWVKTDYIPALFGRLEPLGHVVGWYGAPNALTAAPRFSTGYAAARNRASLLVETHALKSFRTRAWSHYDIMLATLELLAEKGRALAAASLAADRRMRDLAPGTPVFLEGEPGDPTEPYTIRRLATENYTGAASGVETPRYVNRPAYAVTRLNRSLKPRLVKPAPAGYIIPRPWQSVIDVLRAHGVRMETLEREREEMFETYRFEQVQFAPTPFEGRFLLRSLQAMPVREPRRMPAGSIWVPVAQPAGKLVMHFLEPESGDSAVKWGFFHAIFEQKEYFSDYAFEPYAARMLEADPALKREFEAAQLPPGRARLAWLHRRSPYLEKTKDAYPVVRVP